MRKILLDRITILAPLVLLFLVSLNIYIFIDATDKLVTSDLSDIDSNDLPIESDELVDVEPAVVAFDDTVEVKMVSATGLKDEFGGDVSSIITPYTEPNMDLQREHSTEDFEQGLVENVIVSQSSGDTYQVVRGDSLYRIANRFDTSIAELMEVNHLTSTTIHVGQVLEIPNDVVRRYACGLELSDREVKWIAQMIHAEARGEPYVGQVAVGAVIINRVKSSQFPDTVHGVLFQKNAFQPVSNGTFYLPANEQSYRAALEALNGHDPTKGALFFFNPSISNSRFMHARTTLITIGQHRFAI